MWRIAALDEEHKATGLWKLPGIDVWAKKPRPEDLPVWFSAFVTGFRELAAEELPPDCVYGVYYDALTINVPKYLKWLLEQFKSLGGTLEHRRVSKLAEVVTPADPDSDTPAIVVNCTGLGSQTFGAFADTATYPTRGQTILVRAPQIKYTITKLVDQSFEETFPYVIPRDDGIVVLGGTYQEGVDDLEPNPATAEAMLTRCKAICPELANGPCEILEHKVGLRPTRHGFANLSTDMVEEDGRKFAVVHNYGHGGWGYQASLGCAREVFDLVEGLNAVNGADVDSNRQDPFERLVQRIWVKDGGSI